MITLLFPPARGNGDADVAKIGSSFGSAPSLYDRTHAWRMKQREHNESYLSRAATTATLFVTNTSSVQGMTQLAFQQAMQRLQAEAKARIDEQTKSLDAINQALSSVDVTA